MKGFQAWMVCLRSCLSFSTAFMFGIRLGHCKTVSCILFFFFQKWTCWCVANHFPSAILQLGVVNFFRIFMVPSFMTKCPGCKTANVRQSFVFFLPNFFSCCWILSTTGRIPAWCAAFWDLLVCSPSLSAFLIREIKSEFYHNNYILYLP